MSYPPLVIQVALGILVVVAGAFDLKFRRVPNWLVLAGLGAGLGLNTWLSGASGASMALKGAGLALLVYLPLYALRAMGGGDVKLMAAIGSLVGAGNWFVIFVVTGVLGGVIALVVLLWTGRIRQVGRNLWLMLAGLRQGVAPYNVSPELDVRSKRSFSLPHAAVIALGSLLFLWLSSVQPG